MFFLIVLLFLLATAAALGFFIFNNDNSSGESMKLSLAAPQIAASGDQVKIEVSYENIDRIALGQIQAVVQYPQGFYLDRSNLKPSGTQNNIWNLPDLEPGQGGKIEIVGQLTGKQDEEKQFQVTFNYRPANFNSDFKTDLPVKIRINDALFKVDLQKPEALRADGTAEFRVKYKNNTANEIKDLKVIFNLPETFRLTGMTPTSSENFVWPLDKVDPQAEGELILAGKYQPVAGTSTYPWSFRVTQSILKDDQKQERAIYQDQGELTMATADVKVSLNFQQNQQVAWGTNFPVNLVVENNGNAPVQNAALAVDFNTSLIDWTKFNSDTKPQRQSNSLLWNKDIGSLGQQFTQMNPGSKIEIPLQLPIKSQPGNLDSFNPEDLIFEIHATLSYEVAGQPASVQAQPWTSYIGAKAQMITEARYYLDANTSVGSGPVPPAVNKETHYRVYWKLFSGSLGLDNVQIRSTLPSYIGYLKQADQSSISSQFAYDADNRQLTWSLPSVPPNTQLAISFDVSVTPTNDYLNQILVLTHPTTMQAQEKGAGFPVTLNTNLLTSDLTGDPVAEGKGRVVNGN